MAIHNCPDCGLVHEVTTPREDPMVQIERIKADSALEIARLQARTDRHAVDTLAETQEAVAETGLETAVAEAEVIGAAIEAGEVEPEPIVIQDPEPEQPEVTDETVPPDAEDAPEHHAPAKRSLGMWG